RHGRWRRKLLKGERANSHAGIQRHRHAAQVAQLERSFAGPTWIEQTRGPMHNDADTSQTRSALQPSKHVVVQLQRFLRDGEYELAWLQDEWFAGRNHDALHDVFD